MTDKDAATLYDFQVAKSSKISFDHVVVKGQDDEAGYDSAPFMIRDSQNVSVTNSEFTHARYGLSMLDNDGVTISDNYFHDLRTDGVRGGGNSNVTISTNYFTDFNPAEGDHPDAIQFWTTGETASVSNIKIIDNVILRGDGEAMQGIFMRDEAGNLPYKNVVIDGNLIVGGMYHGIYVGNAEGLKITDNTVTGYADQKSWINASDVSVISGNAAELFIVDKVTVAAPKGNKVIQAVADEGVALGKAWLEANPVASAAMQSNPLVAASVLKLVTAKVVPVPLPTTVTGTAGADTLKAAKLGDSILVGGDGNDMFTGGLGATHMQGGAGNDIFNVNSVRDTVVELAGGGDDTVYAKIDYTLTGYVETLRMAASGLVGHGNALDNRIIGSAGVDTLYGEGGKDSIQGSDGNDLLDGGAGDDRLSGDAGNDKLYGGVGADWLSGGAGNDLLEGGVGNDTMTGGAGKDTFSFLHADLRGYDTITDFSSADGDKISLSLVDANSASGADDAFKYLGTGAFTNHAGELRYSVVSGGALVQADVNGDGVADLSIFLQGVAKLAAGDFIL